MDRTPKQVQAQLTWTLVCERLSFVMDPPAGAKPEGELADLAAAIAQVRQKQWGVHSLLVIRHGYAVADVDFYPYRSAAPHDGSRSSAGSAPDRYHWPDPWAWPR